MVDRPDRPGHPVDPQREHGAHPRASSRWASRRSAAALGCRALAGGVGACSSRSASRRSTTCSGAGRCSPSRRAWRSSRRCSCRAARVPRPRPASRRRLPDARPTAASRPAVCTPCIPGALHRGGPVRRGDDRVAVDRRSPTSPRRPRVARDRRGRRVLALLPHLAALVEERRRGVHRLAGRGDRRRRASARRCSSDTPRPSVQVWFALLLVVGRAVLAAARARCAGCIVPPLVFVGLFVAAFAQRRTDRRGGDPSVVERQLPAHRHRDDPAGAARRSRPAAAARRGRVRCPRARARRGPVTAASTCPFVRSSPRRSSWSSARGDRRRLPGAQPGADGEEHRRGTGGVLGRDRGVPGPR